MGVCKLYWVFLRLIMLVIMACQKRASQPSIAHDLPCLPDDGSSIPPLTNMGVLHNLPASYGGSNLDANLILQSASVNTSEFSNNFPDLWIDLSEYQPQKLDFQKNSTVRHVNDVPSSNT